MVTVLAVIPSGFEVSPKPSSGVPYLKKKKLKKKGMYAPVSCVYQESFESLSGMEGARTKGGTLSHTINLPDVSVAMRTQ